MNDATTGPIDIGSRLELFMDDHLVARLHGAERRLHAPVPREVVMVTDRPWEGSACGMITVFQDGGRYRMYYRGLQIGLGEGKLEHPHPQFHCYAESDDGINWERVPMGQVEFHGSMDNNILKLPDNALGLHELAPFKDGNPDASPDARYKAWAVGTNPHHEGPPKTPGAKGLFALRSADGIHWELMSEEPAISYGRFDSHNLCFWDGERGEYRSYHRNWLEDETYGPHEDGAAAGTRGTRGRRDILTATSRDFIDWSESTFLTYARGKPDQLYTNGVVPYFRAPHIFVGLPMRYVERPWSGAIEDLPELDHRRRRAAVQERCGSAVTDTMLMSSRDGRAFDLWHESFIRPGLRPEGNWTYADNWAGCGLVTTRSNMAGAPDEMSLYAVEGYWRGTSAGIRRYSLRMDGFVSVRAPADGGELVTRPIRFSGRELTLNFSASAAGSIRVEILRDEEDAPVKGHSLAECREVLGDDLERRVAWNDSPDVSRLAGIPVRLRFVLRDADLFSFRFR